MDMEISRLKSPSTLCSLSMMFLMEVISDIGKLICLDIGIDAGFQKDLFRFCLPYTVDIG